MYSVISYSKKTLIVSNLKSNRINLIKNYLNVNMNFNVCHGKVKPLLFDFSMNYLSIFAHNLNYKFIVTLQNLHKRISLQHTKVLLYIYFFFKLLGQNLKKISYLKYIYFKYVLTKNKYICYDLHLIQLNSKFIFDFFFLLYCKYLALLKLIIFLLRFTF